MGNCFNKEIPGEPDLDLRQFKLLRAVGKGAFGKVRVVEKKGTGKLFALKYIPKDKAIEKRAVDNVLKERNLLQTLAFYPFLVNLCYAFQDDQNLYIVIDLMLGGDLRYHLTHCKTALPEDLIRFWMAEVILGIQYMHGKGTVHRDLKPENLLLDSDGHIHLTDFNLTTHLPSNGKKLKATCGTLAYMAPELFGKSGYGKEVDFWALGVILFECLFRTKPFRAKSKEELIKIITKGKYTTPQGHPYSSTCLNFLDGLLQLDPSKRLGTDNDGIKAHPFFEGLDWVALEKLELESPFKPDTKRANFENDSEIEEVFDTNPADRLKYRKRKPIDPSTMSQPMLKMEREFDEFNYERYLDKPVSNPALSMIIDESVDDQVIEFQPD